MKKHSLPIYIFIAFFIVFGTKPLLAQTEEMSDSLGINEKQDSPRKKNIITKLIDYLNDTNKEKPEKKFDISFIGGPYYSSDTKFGVGLVASGLYRIDKNDRTISPSNISLYGNFTTSGVFMLGVEGNTIFPKEKYRIDMDVYFASTPTRYWGIGYDRGKDKDNYTKYTLKDINLKADFLRKLFDNAFAGITTTVQHTNGSVMKDISFLEGRDKSSTAIGAGVILSYDSRDFIPNPSKGLYLKLEHNFFPEFMGSSVNFSRTDLMARYYKKVWDKGILAFDFNTILNNGNVPWSMMALVGNSRHMRGYYKGQYRDKKMISTQIELRQGIYKRSGAAVWVGAGNAFSAFDDFDLGETLPSFGIGYRWEFKKRVNVRLDYGIGKKQSGIYFNVNEAF